MELVTAHLCEFRESLVWSDWSVRGAVQEREGRRIRRCSICGRTRPRRTHRPPDIIEREARTTNALVITGDVEKVAEVVAGMGLRRSDAGRGSRLRTRTIARALGRVGWTFSATEVALERLVEGGWLRTGSRLKGSERHLEYVVVRHPDRFYEIVHPGERDLRQQELAGARAAVATAVHPVARDIRERLNDSAAQRLSSLAVKTLAAVAAHLETGDVLSANVFSARYLGGAKELRRVRGGIERLLGPLESLGIRDGGATLLIGGSGAVHLRETELRLRELRPYVGLPRELVMQGTWSLPDDGLLVIENMAAFEAACAGDVLGLGDWLFIWSAGYPGRAVRRVVEKAAKAGRRVRVWADLDLDGVRIARLIASWAGETIEAWRMSADDIRAASVRRPLVERARNATRADLEASPDALLSDTLRALIEVDGTVEQEVFVGRAARSRS